MFHQLYDTVDHQQKFLIKSNIIINPKEKQKKILLVNVVSLCSNDMDVNT